MSIQAPVFVLYVGDRLVAFDEVFEAEMTPVEHFERVERVVDSYGRELRFVVKQQLAARLEVVRSPDEQRLRDVLVQSLQDIGDIDVARLTREELVSRAVESFRLRKDTGGVEWGNADWSPLFSGLLDAVLSRLI